MTTGTTARRPAPGRTPTLRLERTLLRDGHAVVVGVDEVGRGSLAGPVTVGAVAVAPASRSAPVGLRDSKLLTPAARERLAPRLRRWATAWGVGHASPAEIDEAGIVGGLRLAGRRALDQVARSLGHDPTVVVLDGNHDWLSVRGATGLPGVEQVALELAPQVPPARADPLVRTLVKADLRCAAVAAASVLAKTERDAIMVSLAGTHPRYGWDDNKGYSAPEHLAALARHGACPHHRLSWRLPGMMGLPAHAAGQTAIEVEERVGRA